MINAFMTFGLMVIAIFLVVYIVLPDLFPLTGLDEAVATMTLLAILSRFGVRI